MINFVVSSDLNSRVPDRQIFLQTLYQKVMKKIIIFILFELGFVLFCNSQTIKEVEDALLEVTYKRHFVSDTTQREVKFRNSEMKLRIGPTMAMWYSQNKLWADSLRTYNFWLSEQIVKEGAKNDKNFILGGYDWEFIFKNYPTKGTWTVYNRFDLQAWQYSEEISSPEWNLTDSICTILGYDCQMAETFYKGRHWTAFFSIDLPFPEGPWKLNGLPGLILKAFCTNNDYSYEAVNISIQNLPKVGFYDYNKFGRRKVSRDDYFKNHYNAINSNLAKKMSQIMGVKNSGTTSKNVFANYDFEETDYPHE